MITKNIELLRHGLMISSNTAIWRYFSFEKFIDFLEYGRLFFCRVDRFEDKMEAFLKPDEDSLMFGEGSCIWDVDKSKATPEQKEKAKQYRKTKHTHVDPELLVKCCGINCWRIDANESHAMWKIFDSSNCGVAVKTDFSRLDEAIELGKYKIFGSSVYYYDTENAAFAGLFKSFFMKHKHFEHEKEFRLLCITAENHGNISEGYSQYTPLPEPEGGAYIQLNVETAITEIYVSPYAPEWFELLLRKLIHERYMLKIPVKRSDMKLRRN